MALQSVATTKGTAIEVAHQVFDEHPEDVLATVEIAKNRMYQLRSLLNVVADKTEEYSDLHYLVEMGRYLADDTGNYLEHHHDKYRDALLAVSRQED